MRKLSIYFGVVVVLFALLWGLNQMQLKAQSDNIYGIPATKLNPLTVQQLKDPNYQNIILPDNLDKRLQNKESFFVYYFSPDCPHCRATTPVLAPLAKSAGADFNQYNLMEFKQGWQNYKIESTPTLVYYKNGQETDRLVGEQPEQTWKDFLAKHK
jgi:thioredoxin 1